MVLAKIRELVSTAIYNRRQTVHRQVLHRNSNKLLPRLQQVIQQYELIERATMFSRAYTWTVLYGAVDDATAFGRMELCRRYQRRSIDSIAARLIGLTRLVKWKEWRHHRRTILESSLEHFDFTYDEPRLYP